MALVRISRNLTDEVNRSINSISERSYKAVVAPFKPFEKKEVRDILVQEAEKILWEGYAHLRAQMPKEWVVIADRLDLVLKDGNGTVYPEVMIPCKIPCPPNHRSNSYVDVKMDVSVLPPELQLQIKEFERVEQEHLEKFKEVKLQIGNFLRSCKSLNDALRKYPDLALYVPQDYKDKIAEKRDRAAINKEAVEAPPEIILDRNLITSLGVMGALHEKEK